MSPRQRAQRRRNFMRRAERLDTSTYKINWLAQRSTAERRRLQTSSGTRRFERFLARQTACWNNQ